MPLDKKSFHIIMIPELFKVDLQGNNNGDGKRHQFERIPGTVPRTSLSSMVDLS